MTSYIFEKLPDEGHSKLWNSLHAVCYEKAKPNMDVRSKTSSFRFLMITNLLVCSSFSLVIRETVKIINHFYYTSCIHVAKVYSLGLFSNYSKSGLVDSLINKAVANNCRFGHYWLIWSWQYLNIFKNCGPFEIWPNHLSIVAQSSVISIDLLGNKNVFVLKNK